MGRQRPNRTGDYFDAGHGFLVESFANPDVVERCRYCHRQTLPVDETSLGELTPDWDGCECNGCMCRKMGKRNPGHQPEICRSLDCRRALKRDQMR